MIKNILTAIAISLLSTAALAAGGNVQLDHMKPDMSDKVSMQEGLRTYMDYCAACHSLGFARYNRVARDLEIPEDIMMSQIAFAQDAKFGDLMKFAMTEKDGKAWFGAAPPDLTMVTRVRGVDWVYSYMRGFYKDDSRPYGVNNTVFKDVGMPHVLIGLQGLCAVKPDHVDHNAVDPLTGDALHSDACSSYKQEGSLNAHEYDEVVYNLVNFLNYMAEPYQQERKILGWKVLAFLLVLFVFATLLQRELFKDLKH
ncbi:cytochrome c1 [Reinekea sp.]|jgi:ubiquinol-cytochrome c reductase cytochrome c1 subunit|uniref:cytochrome c1 n=1 Tax=Reinekea sp. TaxID=1970455 RepID=UPI0039894672